ncbi:uncharacterized protein BDZ99DRAFT_183291 [Mytilinidion resinicola]|uniref:Uncharacterized protein n=1 Tax=Mytilinidion resinicola TaxID=574789 RepID=A0A6A6Z1V6_9PEZI|nr:uncharacterized protein BDZ99DRAFT_183291 [Mytilinidion resinicola]KAF2814699.1 hypothetical protein BDZ99DRAFT_183291 [Mytilinidion resinicola]
MAANAPYYQLHASQQRSRPFVNNEEYTVERTPESHADTQVNFDQEDNQVAELLEAANEAAGLRNGARTLGLRRKEGVENLRTQVPQGKGKRKRAESSTPPRVGDIEGRAGWTDHDRVLVRATSKRARKDPASVILSQDPALETTGQQIRQPIEDSDDTNARDSSSITASANVHTNANYLPFPSRAPAHDPQLIGGRQSPVSCEPSTTSSEPNPTMLHPATALFRRPPANPPKKYTRPPMSKLFDSLQLGPESFLQLQAQAKSYMLDPAYPARQACVGNRGKGDTDMVKLRLFRCVNDFLVQGAGEQFFGVNAEGREVGKKAMKSLGEGENDSEELRGSSGAETKWIWPRDGNTIVGLVTPLLRRMVTNERQRVYAIETRKGGKKKEGLGSEDRDVQGARTDGFEGVSYDQHPPHLDPSLASPSLHDNISSYHPHPQPIQLIPPLADATLSEDLRIISIHFSSSDYKPLRLGLDLASPTTDTWGLRYADLYHVIAQNLEGVGITDGLHGSERQDRSAHSGARGGRGENTSQRTNPAIPDADPALLRGLRAAAGLDADVNADADSEMGGVRFDQDVNSSRQAPATCSPDGGPEDRYQDIPTSKNNHDVPETQNLRVEALLSTGLSLVRNEDEWERVKREVSRTFWFRGRCTIVVTV